MIMKESIIKLCSVYKNYIWGGTKIRNILHKNSDNMDTIAESWEISTHPAGRSVIAEGNYAGKPLNEYFDCVGWDKVGEYGKKYKSLPVLVKYIDAKSNLSIQVHPDDKFARAVENDSGKNEIWYIVGADKGAFIYLGFKTAVTEEEVRKRIADNSLEELLNKVHVKKGEAYYIPAGTVHAVGKGCFICEIQQTSDVTYRLYDYGRVDAQGNPRELHIEKALQVLDYNAFDLNKYSSRDIEHVGRYLGKMLVEQDGCGFIKYEAEGDFVYASSKERVAFAVVYGGKGTISCDGDSRKTSIGDTWMLTGQTIKFTGKCKAIIIHL